jgi:hypothetical protein
MVILVVAFAAIVVIVGIKRKLVATWLWSFESSIWRW